MNKEELETNLGTIAKSGSLDFKQQIDEKEEVDIIGQFGVGFYSAFMVADKIEVLSHKVKEDKSYLWTGSLDGYEIKNATKEDYGTTITLYIKANTKEKKYDKYLDEYEIHSLIRRYSDFIRYPIIMEEEVTKDGKKEIESKTINSMVPLWKKNKKDLKKEDYNEFYFTTFYDFKEPLKTIHYKVEGNTSYTALLYIPGERANNYFTTDYKLGLKLYSKGVFIKDEAKEIISDHFRFIRGVVDSDDLNLNISREILQEDYQMANLKKSIDKRIKSTLEKMMKDEKEDYEKFFDAFGAQLKYGVYDNFGANKDLLIDLLLFKSTKEDKYVSLKEYVERMKEDQKEIYYATGETLEAIKALPQLERVLDKGYEVLYFTDNIDEFMVTIINSYNDKMFKSVLKGELDIEDEKEKEEIKKIEEDSKPLLDKIKEVLKADISDVRLSTRLKSYPVCLVSDDNLSIDMEKTLKNLDQGNIKANKIMEINPDHEVFKALNKIYNSNEDIEDYVKLLLDQSLLIAGLPIANPVEYAKRLSDLMIKAMK